MDPEGLLNMERRTGINDEDLSDFLRKVDDVQSAIRGMVDGTVDPNEVRVEGVPTEEELREQAEEEKRKEEERRRRNEQRKREEKERWWLHAECEFGEREIRAKYVQNPLRGENVNGENVKAKATPQQIRQRYEMDYSRWDTFVRDPDDPVTLEEREQREEEEEAKRNAAFESANPEFCKGVLDDLEERRKDRERKEAKAKRERLLGNKAFKKKPCRADVALRHYMEALKNTPFAVNVLTNCVQAHMKLAQHEDAIEFCNRCLFVDPKCIKARVRLADALAAQGEVTAAAKEVNVALALAPGNVEVQRKAQLLTEEAEEHCLEEQVRQNAQKAGIRVAPPPPAPSPAPALDGELDEEVQRATTTANVVEPLPSDADVDEKGLSEQGLRQALSSPEAFSLHTVDHILSRLRQDGVSCRVGGPAESAALTKDMFVIDALTEMLIDSKESRTQLRIAGGLEFLLQQFPQDADQGCENVDYTLVEKICDAIAAAILDERRSILMAIESGLCQKLGALLEHSARLLGKADASANGRASLLRCLVAAARLLGIVMDPAKSDKWVDEPSPGSHLLQLVARLLVQCSVAFSAKAVHQLASILQNASFLLGQPDVRASKRLRKINNEQRDPSMALAMASALYSCVQNGSDEGVQPAMECLCAGLANVFRVEDERSILVAESGLLSEPPAATLLRVAAGGHIPQPRQGPPITSRSSRAASPKISNAAKEHALAAMLNGVAGEGGQSVKQLLIERGALIVCLAIVKGSDISSNGLMWLRSATLLGRLASVESASRMLGAKQPLKCVLEQVQNLSNLVSAGTSDSRVFEASNQLVRVLALALGRRDPSVDAHVDADAVIRSLVNFLPAPSVDGTEKRVTSRSVALAPPRGKFHAPLVAHTCKALSIVLSVNPRGVCAALTKVEAVDRIVCAFANYGGKDAAEASVRKNSAILLAKTVQADPSLKDRARELRGMEMLLELGGQLA